MGLIYVASREVLFDDPDADWIHNLRWEIDKDGYAVSRRKGREDRRKLMHRLVMGASALDIVDHRNGNRLDNRRTNLRFCTRSQNGINAGVKKNNTSGFKGVSKLGNVWRAYINADWKQIHLGCFPTAELAASARENAERRMYGEFAFDGGFRVKG